MPPSGSCRSNHGNFGLGRVVPRSTTHHGSVRSSAHTHCKRTKYPERPRACTKSFQNAATAQACLPQKAEYREDPRTRGINVYSPTAHLIEGPEQRFADKSSHWHTDGSKLPSEVISGALSTLPKTSTCTCRYLQRWKRLPSRCASNLYTWRLIALRSICFRTLGCQRCKIS